LALAAESRRDRPTASDITVNKTVTECRRERGPPWWVGELSDSIRHYGQQNGD